MYTQVYQNAGKHTKRTHVQQPSTDDCSRTASLYEAVVQLKRTTELLPENYPLYNKFYKLTKEKFYDLVSRHNPLIITSIPYQMKLKHTIVPYNNNYLLIKEDWDSSEELNNVTDYFTEIIRIQCNFKNQISPFDYWKNNYDIISNKYSDNTSIKTIRDYMYHNVKFCNNFRISVALTILKIFRARKWLDISAGWGDRLLSAIGYGIDTYVGVDPNNNLHPYYDDMINMLVEPDKRKNFVVLNDGFETANIPKDDYDIVFSSPPFFDLETYSSSPKDSIIAHPSVDNWYNDFLIVSLKKAYDNLIRGGHMVLYMGDSVGTKYIDNMVKYMNNLMKSNGSIYYFYEGAFVPRRMFVWKKI